MYIYSTKREVIYPEFKVNTPGQKLKPCILKTFSEVATQDLRFCGLEGVYFLGTNIKKHAFGEAC
jgi:hypothetical protein